MSQNLFGDGFIQVAGCVSFELGFNREICREVIPQSPKYSRFEHFELTSNTFGKHYYQPKN